MTKMENPAFEGAVNLTEIEEANERMHRVAKMKKAREEEAKAAAEKATSKAKVTAKKVTKK